MKRITLAPYDCGNLFTIVYSMTDVQGHSDQKSPICGASYYLGIPSHTALAF
jgi:hypothetical protein